MKTLLLVRHAKSLWEYNVPDTDRILSERGVHDAYVTANHLKEKLKKPEAVFSSPANRALHTCIIFMKTLNISFQKLHILEDLYDFKGEKVIALIRSLDDSYQRIALFGHNYAFTSLCNVFGDKPIDHLPTSGACLIHFDTPSWAAIERGQTALNVFPRNLR